MGYRRAACPVELRCTMQGTVLAGPTEWLLNQLRIWARKTNRSAPVVVSLCRTAERQRELQQRWDAGDRRGLRVRPVNPENSKHVADENGECWAFDLGNDDQWLEAAGAYVLSPAIQSALPGARWGGSWIPKDSVHFDVDGMRTAAVLKLT